MKKKMLVVMLSLTMAMVSTGCETPLLPGDPIIDIVMNNEKDEKASKEIDVAKEKEAAEAEPEKVTEVASTSTSKVEEKEDKKTSSSATAATTAEEKKDKEDKKEKEEKESKEKDKKAKTEEVDPLDEMPLEEARKYLLGSQNGNTYENKYFNLKFTLDDNYIIKSQSEIDETFTEDSPVQLAFSAVGPNLITISVIDLNTSVPIDPLDTSTIIVFSSSIIKSIENQGVTDIQSNFEATYFLNNIQNSLWVTGKYRSKTYYQRSLCTARSSYIILFECSTLIDKDSVDDLLGSIEPIK